MKITRIKEVAKNIEEKCNYHGFSEAIAKYCDSINIIREQLNLAGVSTEEYVKMSESDLLDVDNYARLERTKRSFHKTKNNL